MTTVLAVGAAVTVYGLMVGLTWGYIARHFDVSEFPGHFFGSVFWPIGAPIAFGMMLTRERKPKLPKLPNTPSGYHEP